MVRGIVTVVLIIVLGVGIWMIYHQVSGQDVFTGKVYTHDSTAQKDRMETGAVTIEDQPMGEARPTPSRSDEPGTINTEPVATYGDNTPVMPPARPNPTQSDSSKPELTRGRSSGQPVWQANRGLQKAATYSNDTLPAFSPNGATFAGDGKYQWYRQGDLTYRLDTRNGNTCVAFATEDEWRKRVVYRHACRG